MKRALALWILGLIVTVQVFAQNRSISGTVTDATTGEALIGVSISAKGSVVGTITDFDGKYTLEVPKEITSLVFSYVGYTTMEKPITSLVINAALATDQALIDEVVITALGIKKEEKSITYNAQKVSGSDFDKAKEINVINSLSGKIAGAQITNSSGAVGSSTRIVLRGASSLTGNNQPLFVVDGVPINNSNLGTSGFNGGFDLPSGLASINPDNIKDVTILSGAKASALYGVRGSNGVVLVTTKSGLDKQGSGPIGVEINSSLSFEKPFRLPDYQNSYGQGRNPNYFDWGNGLTIDAMTDESWGPALDKGYEFVQWNSYTVGGKPLPWVSKPNNVSKGIFETGTTWNNSIALSGGNEKGDFRLGFGNLNQKGTLPNTDFNRYTVNLSSSYKLTDNLIPSFSLNYSKEKSNNLPYMGYSGYNVMQQLVYAGRNVDYVALRDWRNLPLAPEGSAIEGTPMNWNTQYYNNPFWNYDNNLNKLNRDRIIGSIQLLYNINDYVSLKIKSGIDFYSQYTTEQKAKGSSQNTDGFYQEDHYNYMELNNEVSLGYDQQFVNKKLGVSLNVSGNLMQQRTKEVLGTLNALAVDGVYSLSNGSNAVVSSSLSENNLNTIRVFGELSWNRFIYADFTVANDWSSRLPKENNSFLSYSTGVSFIPSELLKNQKTLSYLKIRGSWASVGNFGALNPYSISPIYQIRTDIPYTSILIGDPATYNNPALKPERTNEWEIGMDLKLFGNRIGLVATYYDKTSKDLLLMVQTSAASGYTRTWQNAGKMNNKGVELQFNTILLDKKDYKINLFLNWGKNYNKVISVGDGQESLILGGTGFATTVEARPGQPYGLLVGKAFLRDPNGNVVFNNGRPVIDPNTKILGNTQPKWTGGIGIGFDLKGLSISTLFDAKIGGSLLSESYLHGRYAGAFKETLLGRETGIVGNGVKNIGTDENPQYVKNDVVISARDYNQAMFDPSNISESSIFDASYIKWRQLVVSYSLPVKTFKNTKIEGISFGVVARNLLLVYSRIPHIDPETALNNSNGSQGLEFGQIPSNRSIGFNFNIKF